MTRRSSCLRRAHGAPKGVVLTFRALFARIALNHAHIGKSVTGRALVTLPTHFGHGLIGNALTPLFAGGEIVLAPRGLGLAKELGRLIDAERITFMSSVPTLAHGVEALQPADGRDIGPRACRLGAVVIGALAGHRRLVQRGDRQLPRHYGDVELIGGASSVKDGIEDGFVGRPWGGSVAVRLDDGRILSHGEGEIVR